MENSFSLLLLRFSSDNSITQQSAPVKRQAPSWNKKKINNSTIKAFLSFEVCRNSDLKAPQYQTDRLFGTEYEESVCLYSQLYMEFISRHVCDILLNINRNTTTKCLLFLLLTLMCSSQRSRLNPIQDLKDKSEK